MGFRQTENSVVIPEGQGAWQNVTALGSVQRRYLDPVQSQAGYFGTVLLGSERGGRRHPHQGAVEPGHRSAVVDGPQGRPGVTGEPGRTPFNIETLHATLPAQRVVPKAERMPREVLQAVVNTYFDGITSHNGFIVKGHPGCSRYENGFPNLQHAHETGHERYRQRRQDGLPDTG